MAAPIWSPSRSAGVYLFHHNVPTMPRLFLNQWNYYYIKISKKTVLWLFLIDQSHINSGGRARHWPLTCECPDALCSCTLLVKEGSAWLGRPDGGSHYDLWEPRPCGVLVLQPDPVPLGEAATQDLCWEEWQPLPRHSASGSWQSPHTWALFTHIGPGKGLYCSWKVRKSLSMVHGLGSAQKGKARGTCHLCLLQMPKSFGRFTAHLEKARAYHRRTTWSPLSPNLEKKRTRRTRLRGGGGEGLLPDSRWVSYFTVPCT